MDGAEFAKTKRWEQMTGSTRAIVADVLLHGPLPRAELARRLSLSPASLTNLTRPLIDLGLWLNTTSSRNPRQGAPHSPSMSSRTGTP
jgi:DNA-binding Lrp family transcriptional regulator